ncbi:MAG: efflux RND transporter periplasmic adaptor subunit [Gammaproteobacteria bacterium]|nr:efflux RND transporter periplasmic adaptor subunit [Gammaproteobacteria bacterium]
MSRLSSFLTILALPIIAGCQANSEESGEIIYLPVEAVRISAQPGYQLTRSFTGVVLPAQRAEIAFEFSGTIENILVNEGDQVDVGELVAKLDTALLEIERRQLQAQLAESQADLRLTRANLLRQTSLESDGYASRQHRDELEAARDAVDARIRQLRAALDGNQVKQEKAHLYTPFAGVIGERFLEQGSAAAPGLPVLRVLETGRLEAHIGVPRELAGKLQPADEVSVIVGKELIGGKVLAVGAELKSRSHTVKVRIGLELEGALSGSLVQLQLPDRIGNTGFTIPLSALSASLRGLWRVYLLRPVGKDLFRVESRDLQLRYAGEREAFVEGGLHDGDLLVASGVHRVVPGQIVRIATERS